VVEIGEYGRKREIGKMKRKRKRKRKRKSGR
jgi:hypothetical protein